jgi:transcriptional regulator GlxA family with amidase domain
MHRVAALVVPDVIIFDLAIPAEIFGRAVERDRYSFAVCTEHPGTVSSASGFDVRVDQGLEALEHADTVIVPGFFPRDDPSLVVIDALRSAAARGARIASVCVGAFALAAAGLLDGCNATTHWEFADELATRFPTVRVLPEVLYVDEGQVLTSAGIAAGIDLCLYMVRGDYGTGRRRRCRGGWSHRFTVPVARHSSWNDPFQKTRRVWLPHALGRSRGCIAR